MHASLQLGMLNGGFLSGVKLHLLSFFVLVVSSFQNPHVGVYLTSPDFETKANRTTVIKKDRGQEAYKSKSIFH
jgi:hypothetical protein